MYGGDAWWIPVFSSSWAAGSSFVFWAWLAGHTATPLDSKQERKKQRNMRRGAWVKNPDY